MLWLPNMSSWANCVSTLMLCDTKMRRSDQKQMVSSASLPVLQLYWFWDNTFKTQSNHCVCVWCSYMLTRVYAPVPVGICTCAGGYRSVQASSSFTLHLIFWVRISYWTLSASVWLEYMANGLRESPVFLSLGLEIIDTYHHDWLNVGARDPYKCPHSCSASSWPISFSPKFGTVLFVKQSIQR